MPDALKPPIGASMDDAVAIQPSLTLTMPVCSCAATLYPRRPLPLHTEALSPYADACAALNSVIDVGSHHLAVGRADERAHVGRPIELPVHHQVLGAFGKAFD